MEPSLRDPPLRAIHPPAPRVSRPDRVVRPAGGARGRQAPPGRAGGDDLPRGRAKPRRSRPAFQAGAFRLAASLAAPVLPVTIAGGHDAWPPGRLLPRPRRITITYHRTLHPDPSLGPRQAAGDLARWAYAVVVSALFDATTR